MGVSRYLMLRVTEDIAHRQQARLARLTRRAQCSFLKTIDDFNFNASIDAPAAHARLGDRTGLRDPRPIAQLLRQTRRGKTHPAIAVAHHAIQNGFDAFFTTAATLIGDLSAAFCAGQFADALQTYMHASVLVVDEVGHLTYVTSDLY